MDSSTMGLLRRSSCGVPAVPERDCSGGPEGGAGQGRSPVMSLAKAEAATGRDTQSKLSRTAHLLS